MIEYICGKTFVKRICDDCGRSDLVNKFGLKVPLTGKTYCKKCCYKHREMHPACGANHKSWKGGIYKTQNGYLRIGKTNQYLHKYLYEKHLGRKIEKHEKIHHIDLNKTNNEISNMYLFPNKSTHSIAHFSLESCCLKLLNCKIWFDRNSKKYSLEKSIQEKIAYDLEYIYSLPKHYQKYRNGLFYEYRYLGNKKHETTHKLIMEKILGRDILQHEHVHHIDGDPRNNDPSNLILLNRSEHKIAHNSLQEMGAKLYLMGIIRFENGSYKNI